MYALASEVWSEHYKDMSGNETLVVHALKKVLSLVVMRHASIRSVAETLRFLNLLSGQAIDLTSPHIRMFIHQKVVEPNEPRQFW